VKMINFALALATAATLGCVNIAQADREGRVQSFNPNDVLYWVANECGFGKQAVYLEDVDPTVNPPIPRLSLGELQELKRKGVRVFAPPMWALLAVNGSGEIVPSQYAADIKQAGLDIITWTFERADLREGAAKGGAAGRRQ
jgi:glycerophosphoryl diester phosphodiesterase